MFVQLARDIDGLGSGVREFVDFAGERVRRWGDRRGAARLGFGSPVGGFHEICGVCAEFLESGDALVCHRDEVLEHGGFGFDLGGADPGEFLRFDHQCLDAVPGHALGGDAVDFFGGGLVLFAVAFATFEQGAEHDEGDDPDAAGDEEALDQVGAGRLGGGDCQDGWVCGHGWV